mmetsp:Transcript_42526/g.112201  ORF Transcript_42526/g.112201 Transcript_42526/m.112201 type:complete len:211 (+) Transcript_42526:345-977(+)
MTHHQKVIRQDEPCAQIQNPRLWGSERALESPQEVATLEYDLDVLCQKDWQGSLERVPSRALACGKRAADGVRWSPMDSRREKHYSCHKQKQPAPEVSRVLAQAQKLGRLWVSPLVCATSVSQQLPGDQRAALNCHPEARSSPCENPSPPLGSLGLRDRWKILGAVAEAATAERPVTVPREMTPREPASRGLPPKPPGLASRANLTSPPR